MPRRRTPQTLHRDDYPSIMSPCSRGGLGGPHCRRTGTRPKSQETTSRQELEPTSFIRHWLKHLGQPEPKYGAPLSLSSLPLLHPLPAAINRSRLRTSLPFTPRVHSSLGFFPRRLGSPGKRDGRETETERGGVLGRDTRTGKSWCRREWIAMTLSPSMAWRQYRGASAGG